jgi:PKD repeat protein
VTNPPTIETLTTFSTGGSSFGNGTAPTTAAAPAVSTTSTTQSTATASNGQTTTTAPAATAGFWLFGSTPLPNWTYRQWGLCWLVGAVVYFVAFQSASLEF